MRMSNREAVDAMRARMSFASHTGSLRGVQYSNVNEMDGHGRLPSECRQALLDADPRATLYVVYSYGTPIGWCCDGAWTIPQVRYSNTTSRHQGLLAQAVPFIDDDGIESA